MEKGMTTRTTKEHFKLFKSEVEKWIQRFGLTDAFLLIRHDDLKNGIGAMKYNYTARTATIFLAKKPLFPIPTENIIAEIKSVAFHEVCELLLARLACLAGDRSYCEEDYTSETHAVIARLENYLKPEGE